LKVNLSMSINQTNIASLVRGAWAAAPRRGGAQAPRRSAVRALRSVHVVCGKNG
jgi:hypothetical protein